MSQLRKSASFRSRIPVRARVPQRRCSSPQPVSSKKSRQNKKNSKFFFDRFYSSSSYSSSDESHDSEEPLQSLLKLSATEAANSSVSRSNISTDEMSLNGLLDNVSCGSFSAQNSPPSTAVRGSQDFKSTPSAENNLYPAPLSSYESLDKFNCASETLKITDDYHQQKQNIINQMNHAPSFEIISTSEKKVSSSTKQLQQLQSMNSNYKLMNSVVDYDKTSSLRRQSNNNDDYDSSSNANDNEVASNKQKQLSDWYYIKTSPKAKPSSPYDRRKVKNFLNHPTSKSIQSPTLHGSLNNRNSNDKIGSLHDDNEFIPIQKYRSNDYIEHHPEQQNVVDISPQQTYKCFNVKYSKNPSGRSSETKFGDMTSSSFEHVNVTGLYDNSFSESEAKLDHCLEHQ